MITVHDQQTGNDVSGTVANITEFSFDLLDESGDRVGTFSRDNLVKQSNFKDYDKGE